MAQKKIYCALEPPMALINQPGLKKKTVAN